MHKYRTHKCDELRHDNVKDVVKLSGWVHRKRDHGQLIFIDLRDHYGLTQVVVDSSNNNFSIIENLTLESVITIKGIVVERSSDTINKSLPTGDIEVNLSELEIISKSNALPLQVNSDEDYGEETRLKFRYLDLRRNRPHSNIILRSNVIQAIRNNNLTEGKDIGIALDCAASEFYKNGTYNLAGESIELNSSEFTNYLSELAYKYPILSIEDGMDESDFEGWKNLTKALGDKCQLVGDDLFVTNVVELQRGIDDSLANSILIKFNQIGTITETMKTIYLGNKNGFKSIISHRSGETEDSTIADLCVGLGTGQIKTGAPCRSDRVAKYNRLLWIEAEQPDLTFARNVIG